MAAPRTRSDLVLEILDKLGVIAAGQTPGVEDTTRVDELIPAALETLAADEVVYVADPNSINAAYFEPLSYVIAYMAREKFGVVGEEAINLKNKNDENVAILKRITRGRPTYERQRAEYF